MIFRGTAKDETAKGVLAKGFKKPTNLYEPVLFYPE